FPRPSHEGLGFIGKRNVSKSAITYHPAVLLSIAFLTAQNLPFLFAESGFHLQRTIPTSSEMNIIEAVPV
ncbi:MAG: hypothetical protein ACM32I_06400, partial [Nitrospirota bacterium]